MAFTAGGHQMGTGDLGSTYAADFTGREFALTEVGYVTFAVENRTAGTVTIQAKFAGNDDWQTLDATELVFTADGVKTALVGGCLIRALGSGTTNTDINVHIHGKYVHIA